MMVLSQYEGEVHEGWLAPWWSRTLWYFHNTKDMFTRDGLHLGGPGHYGTFPIRRRSSRGMACTLVVQDIMVLSQYEGEVHERWLAPWWSRTLWYFHNTKEMFMRDGLHLGGPGHYGTFPIRRRSSRGMACTLVVQDIMVLSQ